MTVKLGGGCPLRPASSQLVLVICGHGPSHMLCGQMGLWSVRAAPKSALLVSAASMGVRWMIGVTEIDKGSAYGNSDSKQKQND